MQGALKLPGYFLQGFIMRISHLLAAPGKHLHYLKLPNLRIILYV